MKIILWFALILLLLSACQSTKPLFSTLPNVLENDSLALQILQPQEPILVPGDKVTVSIWGHDKLSIGSVNSIYAANEETGKWLIMDDEGKVNLPKLGRTKISGLTIKEANYFLEQRYSKILKDPIINVRVQNHFVTVLGEVNSPGRYSLGNELLSLVDIIAKAEGLSEYAKNEEIELVRIINDRPVKLTVNLTDLVSLPRKNVILQPNDIIYIGATSNKSQDRNLAKASLITGIVTGIAVIFSVFSN